MKKGLIIRNWHNFLFKLYVGVYFWALFSVHCFMGLFLYQYHALLITRALKYSLKSGNVRPPAFSSFSEFLWLFVVFCGFIHILDCLFLSFCEKCHWKCDTYFHWIYRCSQLLFDKDTKNIQWVRDNLFNNVTEKTGYTYLKQLNRTHILYHLQKLTQNWLQIYTYDLEP